MLYSIDRIEGEFAVCEDDGGNIVKIPLSELYDNPKEGDMLKKLGEKYVFDKAETDARRKKIIALQNSLFE